MTEPDPPADSELPDYTDRPMFMTPEPPGGSTSFGSTPWAPLSRLPEGPPLGPPGGYPPGGLPPGTMVPGQAAPVGSLPIYPAAQAPTNRRRGPVRLVALVVAVLALVAGASFAAYALTRPDGADSPEGAVRQLFSAIDHEDALGVIESLPPSERKVLHDPLVDSTSQLQRLGVLKSFSLSDVPGADLKVTGLTTETTKLGDGVVLVDVTGGTISGTSIPDQVPLGDNLRKAIEDNGGTVDLKSNSFSEDLADAHLHLVAVQEGGGWHVSLAYSIAESVRNSARDDNGHAPPVPDFGHGPTPVGADSPEGAVHGMVDAAVAYDAQKAVTLTDPQEMRALYDYAPLFLPDLARSATQAKADGDVTVEVDRLDTSVDGDGSVRRVRITGFDVTLGDDTDNVHVVFDGTCYDTTSTFTYSSDYGSYDPETGKWTDTPSTGEPQVDHEHVCAGDPEGSSGGSALGLFGAFGSASAEPFAITVTQVDGRWYVSPLRTILDDVVDGLKALQPEDVQKWGDLFGSFDSAQTFEGVGSAVPDDPTSIDPGINPSGPSTTDLSGSGDPSDTAAAEELLWSLRPSALAAVSTACPAQIDAFESSGDLDAEAYWGVVRDVIGCASGVVPDYSACVPFIDVVIAMDRTPGADDSAAVDRVFSCLGRVTG